jgi:CRISPR-associated protein Cas1
MLNEFAYCPRLAYLEWVQGEFEDSADTVEGRYEHRRVDEEAHRTPRADSSAEADRVGPRPVRSAMLSAERVGLIARIDLLEEQGGTAVPMDYKRGPAPEKGAEPWEPERVQLCAQALILRENGFQCDRGVIYYAASRARVDVPIDEALVGRTLELIEALREMARSAQLPAPLEDSPKCPRCSLVGICLPDETNLLGRPDRAAPTSVRQLVPPAANALPLYVQEQGAMVTKRGDVLEVRRANELLGETRLLTTSQVCLFGNVQVTTQALRELAARGIPACYFSYGGWFYAIAQGMTHKNVELRQAQYRAAWDQEKSLDLARRFVEGKIRNGRTLIRRNHPDPPPQALEEMARLMRRARHAADMATLLGIEGAAARVYFANLAGLLKPQEAEAVARFDFTTRNRRPPRDPVNALLSFCYALLVKDLGVALLAAGFDPYLGFYHQPRYGRPALALDLAEEFRPLVAESVVLTLVNNGEVREADFISRLGAVALTARGRRQVLDAYERRLDTTVTHPLFGYSISYRRVVSVQARLLGRYLFGEIESYTPFCTR